jgi:hypothetical protein
MHLFDFLEEQHALQYTGRLKIFDQSNSDCIGHVFFSHGEILHAKSLAYKDLRALLNLTQISKLNGVRIIVEPEDVDREMFSVEIPFVEILQKLRDWEESLNELVEHAPPPEMKFKLNAEFLYKEDGINSYEFDIYKNSYLLNFEVTASLLSLKKKKAFTVINSKNS